MKLTHLKQNGFILVATLWILAAITLGAGFFALWTQNILEIARQEQDDLQGIIDMQNTRSALLYLLGTQHITIAGLTLPGNPEKHGIDGSRLEPSVCLRLEPSNIPERFTDPMKSSILPIGGELPLDDRPYHGIGKACFSIQDEGGLLSLNYFQTSPYLERLIGLMGVPAHQRGPLMDKLLDYTDEDDFHRLNGAEAKDYEKLGLNPPPNRFLLTNREIRNVLGWNEYPELWGDNDLSLPRLTTTASGVIPNPNTAPKILLKTIANIDDETAGRIIDARKKKPFSYPGEISLAAGKNLSLDPMGLPLFPSSRLRITLWYQGGKYIREIHLRLTPKADKKAPWLTDYELSLPITKEQENAKISNLSISCFTAPVYSDPK